MARRRNRRLGLLAFACAISVLAAACGQFKKAVGINDSPAGGPSPDSAILLSLPADAVYMVDPGSGRRVTVAANMADFQSGYAAWSPSHKVIAYGNAGIILVNPDTLKTTTFIKGQLLSMPAWSPKGKQIVYGDGTAMWVTPVSKPAPVELAIDTSIAPIAPFAFDWKSGPTIVFQGLSLDCANQHGCAATGTSDLWTIRSNGTELTQITATTDATAPKWAPDGSLILFVRASAKASLGSQLWIVKPNGTGLRRLIGARNVVAADWSRDGKQIVVVRTVPATDATSPQTLQVWVGNANGTGLQPIGEPIKGEDATIDW
jgi:hypothetical protein